ncbi:hypothetical protein JCM3770_003654 [Rhodotorula araucariae]
MSPDHKRRRVDRHAGVGELPHAVPPIAVSAAPPSPPSPPLSSVSALALFAAEMVAWLWFAPSGTSTSGAGASAAAAGGGAAVDLNGVTKLQVRPSDRFVRFCQEVLSTTQVSESVVLLALLFISRLKQRNAINGAQGSEYRLAVTGLMLANKILDDNTYTAQTWSQVSSLELGPLVAGEAEFLRGLDWSLHVTGRDFEAWRKLLDGHVAARNARVGRLPAPLAGLSPGARKMSSNTRVREGVRQTDLRGLGVGLESSAPPPTTLRVPVAYDSMNGTLRRPRGRLGAASTNTTPTSSFASFTFGVPASAPHPQQLSSAPPSHYQPVTTADPSRNQLDISPTAVAFYRSNSGYRASAPLAMPGLKRNADDAFASEPFVVPALPPHVQAQAQAEGYMSRSYSAGPAGPPGAPATHTVHAQVAPTPAAPAFFVHPAHHVAPIPWTMSSSPHNSRPSSSSSTSSHPPPPPYYTSNHPHQATDFSTLSDAFSPRYAPDEHHRLRQAMSLGYYSLASGYGLGHLHQTLPPPPSMGTPLAPYGMYARPYAAPVFIPPYPMTFSAATSPTAPSQPFEGYAHPYPTPTPSIACYPGIAAPPMMHSVSQFAPPPPPSSRVSGHRRTSSGHTRRGGSGSPIGPASAQSTYSPLVPLSAGPYAFPPAFLPPPPPPPQQHQRHAQPLPPPGYYSAYSNAGLPGVYFRG